MLVGIAKQKGHWIMFLIVLASIVLTLPWNLPSNSYLSGQLIVDKVNNVSQETVLHSLLAAFLLFLNNMYIYTLHIYFIFS